MEVAWKKGPRINSASKGLNSARQGELHEDARTGRGAVHRGQRCGFGAWFRDDRESAKATPVEFDHALGDFEEVGIGVVQGQEVRVGRQGAKGNGWKAEVISARRQGQQARDETERR